MTLRPTGHVVSGNGRRRRACRRSRRRTSPSDQETRWCPGCGDYAVLASVQSFMPELGIPPDRIVFVTGIGCAGRFVYYMDTYGMHGIHGRAPALATGVATSRPDLSVWVVSGDGDALSIGGNHLIHSLRRNVPIKILLFNNQIYGLTKGQYSPTSEEGKVTKSTPFGSQDHPFNPVALALGAEATFVARTVDTDKQHLADDAARRRRAPGASFVEIYQNCNVFNDGAFDAVRAKGQREQNQIRLEHGKPIRFGAEAERGVARGARRPAGPGGRGGRGRGRARSCTTPTARTRASRSSSPTWPRARPAPLRSGCSAMLSARSTARSWRSSSRRPARTWARRTSRSCCTPGRPGRWRRGRPPRPRRDRRLLRRGGVLWPGCRGSFVRLRLRRRGVLSLGGGGRPVARTR